MKKIFFMSIASLLLVNQVSTSYASQKQNDEIIEFYSQINTFKDELIYLGADKDKTDQAVSAIEDALASSLKSSNKSELKVLESLQQLSELIKETKSNYLLLKTTTVIGIPLFFSVAFGGFILLSNREALNIIECDVKKNYKAFKHIFQMQLISVIYGSILARTAKEYFRNQKLEKIEENIKNLLITFLQKNN